MYNYLNPQKVVQVFFIIIMVFLVVFIGYHLAHFISSILASFILYILLRKFNFYLVEKRKWKKWLASITLVLLSLLVFVIPAYFFGRLLFQQVSGIISNPTPIIAKLENFVHKIEEAIDYKILTEENIASGKEKIAAVIPDFLQATVNTFNNTLITFFVLYFLLASGRKFEAALANFIPIKHKNSDKIGNELNQLVISNSIVIPLLAIIQGICSYIAYLIIGLDNALLWGTLTGVVSIIPIVGTLIIWMPIAISLIIAGGWEGYFLVAYGYIVIINVDNVARMIFQKKYADVHPLITAFGIFLGLGVFGFIGLIIGPIIISLTLLLFKIYCDEFLDESKSIALIDETD